MDIPNSDMQVMRPDEIIAHIVACPPAPNHKLEMQYKGWNVNITVTDQILIQFSDGTYSTNPMAEWCKVIGEANERNDDIRLWRRIRFEGPTFNRKETQRYWELGVKDILEQIDHGLPGFPPNSSIGDLHPYMVQLPTHNE